MEAAAAPQAVDSIAKAMPMVPFGKEQISRLVLGAIRFVVSFILFPHRCRSR